MKKQKIFARVRVFLISLIVFLFAYLLRINLVVPAFLLLLYAYAKSRYRTLELRRGDFLNLVFLFVIYLAAGYFVLSQNRPQLVFYLPFSFIPLLASILFLSLEASLLLILASAISIASLNAQFNYLGIIILTVGLASIILVHNSRTRNSIIRAGFLIGILQVLLFLCLDLFHFKDPNKYFILLINGLASSVIVVGILPVFEYLFKKVTNISLLELADFNHPLLQKMILEAPGTYHHSLIVGNLSDAACSAVGANSLLARIGAYYHDIGKLSKPDYFSENQFLTASKHDVLAPTMSKLVIINHVKEGVELAKKYKLNPILIDFIQQHHGSSLVYFFYRRALENVENEEEVKEEGFRYPGPKPTTKETAIVLLADSVEAATRALKEPTAVNITETVHKIVNNKFIDGQLDECDLTLKDLERISQVFTRVLTSMYHSRVTYPEASKSENNDKKPTKEGSARPQDAAPGKEGGS